MQHGHTAGRGKVNTAAHLQGTDMSFTFTEKESGQGREACTIIEQSRKSAAWLIIIKVSGEVVTAVIT